MKSYNYLWVLILFAPVFLGGASPLHAEETWVFVGFTKYRDALYVHKPSISRSSPNVVEAWTIISVSKKSKYIPYIEKELAKSQKSARGVKFTEIQNAIDCTGNMIRYLQVLYINEEGRTIHSASAAEQEWKIIHPGSLWHNVRNAVCGN